ncbi:uncharacterized protein LOC125710211 [Brienomyrus brachyistius]|uniref:uncharacterized protein LOC125710211 n=1 Tax=Brienomyrus brachyistius TaxID=42636 RepID=UPI0020B4440C|nr:uncharacterized protein LOC125710211 [Brienomyrus brachyistius]XP_048835681.1 uncharacterized protein LOC125710211 [Brienomyrus brachyistius]
MQRDTLEYAFYLLLWSVHIFTEGLMNDCLEVGSSGLFPCINSLSNESVFVTCNVQKADGNKCTVALDLNTSELSSTCDPRISFNKTGFTMFLSISDIQQADEGNYSCQYSYSGGTNVTDFNICVSESPSDNPTEPNKEYSILFSCSVSIGILCIVILILWRLLLCRKSGTQRENLSSHADEDMKDFEPYSTFILKNDGPYSVVVLSSKNP